MLKTRSQWTRLALAFAIGALSLPGVADAGSRDRGRTPSKPAKEIVRAERAVQKMARQQEKAARKAASRSAPQQVAKTPNYVGRTPSLNRSRTYTSTVNRSGGQRHGSAYKSHAHSSSKGYYGSGKKGYYAHSGHKHKSHSYKRKSYSYPSLSIGIGFSSCGSVGHVCTSACASYGYRYGSSYRYGSKYCYPYWYYRPSFAYCPPSVVYNRYSYSAYPSSRYVVGSVDYFPAGDGVTTWQDQTTGSAADYYAWQRDMTLPDTPALSTVAPSAEPAAVTPVTPPPSGSGDLLADAWAALVAGDAAKAIGYFSTVADSAPELVQPKVGYALAAASQGNIRPAAWSMRRAWSQNPESIRYIPIDDKMIERLNAIAEDLRKRAIAGAGTVDLWFVAASVDYLRFQPEQAQEAADRARILGDEHPSLEALRRRLAADRTGE